MEACAKAKFQRYGSRRVNLVEPACQRAAPLLGTDDAGVAYDGGGMFVEEGLLSDTAHRTHPLTSQ